ncbi:hypothetical protein DFH08DRAFT_159964 [Mycena albidolilacea]|uniref:F-box domain-containing protein n=1 Tax=Mycena albidolilacea TaxID=1033008 RepID=A0AAD7EQJ7_9AGAR|nr:hypothetical protein DFH08DRAFT_159964 [Mycena albidolilacea]
MEGRKSLSSREALNELVPTHRTLAILQSPLPYLPVQTLHSRRILAMRDQFPYPRVDAVDDGDLGHLHKESHGLDEGNSTAAGVPPIHPILSLAPELISLIFVHCLPSLALGQQELHPSKAPILLTHICGAWRALALRTPALWASVAFQLFHRLSSAANPQPLELQFCKLAWWLAQGASHPLTLFLHCRQQHPDIVPLLVGHAARWADVDLFLHPTTLAAFASGLELEVPLLRRLSLGCSPGTLPHITTLFATAPRLTDVSLLKLPLAAVKLPWCQLAHFYASCAEVNDVVRVLRLAPALQRLQLDFQHWPPLPSLTPPPDAETESKGSDVDVESDITHDSLTSLTLHTHPASPVPLPLLLGLLTLPSLASLTLPPLGPADIHAFAAFALRSRLSHTLRELTLALAPLPCGAILDILAPLLSLQKLELRFPGEVVLGDVLRALTLAGTEGAEAGEGVSDGADPSADAVAGTESEGETDEDEEPLRAPFLPSLQHLYVDCFRGTVPYTALRAALEARWSPDPAEERGYAEVEANSAPPPPPSMSTSPSPRGSADQDRSATAPGPSPLRSFALTTLAPTPVPPKNAATPSHTSPSLAPSMAPFWKHPDADVAALRALKARGMDVSVAYVYGGRVV